MIKFFRSIRQRLLSENKLTRYLIYAAGEIILVVIGILIALQINNWNEESRNSKKEIYILEELQKEFINDSLKLDRFIFLTGMKMRDGIDVKRTILKKKKLSRDTLIFKTFFNGRVVLFESYTPTYDELVSTGKLDLIKNDELKKLINDYKRDIETQRTFFFFEAQRRKEAYNKHVFKYFEPQIMSALWERESTEKLLTYETDVKGFLNDPESLYHVNTVIGVDRELKWRYSQRSIWRLVTILEILEKELKSKSND